MKKILWTLFGFWFLIDVSYAFSIDVNKIDIFKRGEELIKNIDSNYRIEGNSNVETQDNSLVIEFVNKILHILDSDSDNKYEEIVKFVDFSEESGGEIIANSLYLQMFLDEYADIKEYSYVKLYKVVKNDDGIFVFVYLKEAIYGEKQGDIELALWLTGHDDELKLKVPFLVFEEKVEDYFASVQDKEESGNVLGGSFKSLGIYENEMDDIKAHDLFSKTKDSVVEITGISGNGENVYGSGFVLRPGVIVTSWALFLDCLVDSNFIYVTDVANNVYKVLGIVSADYIHDTVVLKLSEEVGTGVKFASDDLQSGSMVYSLNSFSNDKFSIKYGSYLGSSNGKLNVLMSMHDSLVGGALFDESGNVIGINSRSVLNSSLGVVNEVGSLVSLQESLYKSNFSDISYVELENFKDSYYQKVNEEVVTNDENGDIWLKYEDILNEEIVSRAIKLSYEDQILSLRFRNDTILDNFYLVSDLLSNLEDSDYELVVDKDDRKVYQNNKYKVIIKDVMSYAIVLVMER